MAWATRSLCVKDGADEGFEDGACLLGEGCDKQTSRKELCSGVSARQDAY